MTRFFTADQHFGHTNILKFEPNRLHQNVDDMNSAIVDAWNAVVTDKDMVYCLGDMSFKLPILREMLRFLNGQKVLVVGNHDPFFKDMASGDKKIVEVARKKAIASGFLDAHMTLELEISGIGLVKMSHFPYFPQNTEGLENYELRCRAQRPVCGNESLLLHGHVHSQWDVRQDAGLPPQVNVGIDVWNLRPVSEEEIVAKFSEIQHA